MSKGNVMTREQKLYAMRMVDLAEYAERIGVKINTKAKKSLAVEKILAFENAQTDELEGEATKEKEAEEKLQAEKDKITEDTMNKKKVKSVQTSKVEDPDYDKKVVETSSETTQKLIEKPKRGSLIEYNGKSQTISAWSKELNKPIQTLYGRIYILGWSVEKAFTK